MSSRLASALVASFLAVSSVTAVAATPALALEPPRPLPGYRPDFVTEVQAGKWEDCLWASAAMLLDKWTNGQLQPGRDRLRALSGDHAGGSNLPDVARAFALLGVPLRYSPGGGDRISWNQLLARLARGAGAVIVGRDGALPRYYGRWDLQFWKKKGKDSYHAVYVERYDARAGRVWLMDPLARGTWTGEWISVRALRRFALASGGALYAATTPTAAAAPFSGVRLGSPTLVQGESGLAATWPVTAPRGWRFQGADVSARFTALADPIAAAVSAAATGPVGVAALSPTTKASLGYRSRALTATVPLPRTPGAYGATIVVTDRRFGHQVASATGVTTFVPGNRASHITFGPIGGEVLPGSSMTVSFVVANTGTTSWADDQRTHDIPATEPMRRSTQVVAMWVPVDLDDEATAGQDAVPDAVPVLAVPMAAGQGVAATVEVATPTARGTFALVLDVTDAIDGSFAAMGSAPAVAVIGVRGVEAASPVR